MTAAPASAPSWDAYPQTVLEVGEPPKILRVDLRSPLTADAIDWLRRVGPWRSFAVLTSDDPHGRPRDEAENAQARAALRRTLADREVPVLPTDGVSPCGSHRERGIAAWMDREPARELARTFGQSAFFWFDGSAFWIEGAVVHAPPVRLPRER